MMKKAIVLALTVSLVGGAMAAPATAQKKKKKKKPVKVERVIEHEYMTGSPGVAGVIGACLATFVPETACINVPTTASEKYVNVEVDDATGTTPYVILAQQTDPEALGFTIFAKFCGSTEEPVELPAPGGELRISLYQVGTCPGTVTTGKITATLSNLP
jgi:hypothetical protein